MEKISKMAEIPEFFVTNRTFEQICSLVKLTEQDITHLPKNATILEIGSGVFQNFARQMSEIRPDVQVVSIDPSLAIGIHGKNNFELKTVRDEERNVETAIYQNKGILSSFIPPKKSKVEELQSLQELRIKEALKTGNVLAALAPDLPIKDSSLDLIIDVYGPGFYIQVNQESEIERYFREIHRVLKPAGEIRIFPAVNMDLYLRRSNVDEDFSREFSKVFFQKIFEKNNLNFEINFLMVTDPDNQEKSNVLVLKKK